MWVYAGKKSILKMLRNTLFTHPSSYFLALKLSLAIRYSSDEVVPIGTWMQEFQESFITVAVFLSRNVTGSRMAVAELCEKSRIHQPSMPPWKVEHVCTREGTEPVLCLRYLGS